MPKIHQELILSTFFLYRSTSAARSGKDATGTGFVVKHLQHLYAVTNRHVARDAGASVIRLNTFNAVGGFAVLDIAPEDWETNETGADIAVTPLSLPYPNISSINSNIFVTKRHSDIGVGDDAFMLGLFADHEGNASNNPLARFGNVSMLADSNSPILHKGNSYESHIIDMHSRSGFSGSPVFVYRTFGGNLENLPRGERVTLRGDVLANNLSSHLGLRQPGYFEGGRNEIEIDLHANTMLRMLGIHWGQFPERWELKDTKKLQESSIPFVVSSGSYIEGFSGMTCVSPSWKILELIESPSVAAARERIGKTVIA